MACSNIVAIYVVHHFRDIIIYFPKLQRSLDCDHTHFGDTVIPRLIVHMANQCTQVYQLTLMACEQRWLLCGHRQLAIALHKSIHSFLPSVGNVIGCIGSNSIGSICCTTCTACCTTNQQEIEPVKFEPYRTCRACLPLAHHHQSCHKHSLYC